MKKFKFSLDKVLDYKEQVLVGLKTQHSLILAQIRKQEDILHEVEARFQSENKNYSQRKMKGIKIADALSYEMGLSVLSDKIVDEEKKLKELQLLEAEKRSQVIEGKKDTASLEILRDKKLDLYKKLEQKSEEQFIEEVVGRSRAFNESR